jgi:ABC-type nitrate/sulfonate/bicarbonate transport system ATPase subunit
MGLVASHIRSADRLPLALAASRGSLDGPRRDIEISKVTLTYPGDRNRAAMPVLDDVSLSVESGSFICLIGPSGCGKSSLLSVVAGYLPATLGGVIVGGRDIAGPGPDRVMVFQSPTLYPWLTVSENIAFGPSLRSQRRRALPPSMHFMKLVGLDGFGAHYPYELSGGMRQRVEIARALAVDPGVLLMDEPFGALDAMTRLTLQGELMRIWKETRKTILFVTHDITEAVFLADRIVVMSQRPATIKQIIEVDIPRPRRRDAADVAALARGVAGLLDMAF